MSATRTATTFAHSLVRLVTLICLLLSAGGINAQVTTATLYGSVADASGSSVPNAAVTATNNETGAAFSTTSDERGEFSLTFLPRGLYTILIKAANFKSHQQTNLEMIGGQTQRLSYTLEVGNVSESVTVTADTPLINTATSEQQFLMTQNEVRELPTFRRNWTGLLNRGNGIVTQANGVSLNGLPRNGFTFTIDGTDAEGDPEQPGVGLSRGFENIIQGVSLEAISEIRVAKGIVPAEVNTSLAGNVNILTRGGTNDFHGSLFENHQSGGLNARPQFSLTKPPLVFNQFGGSFGGPIIKNKIFFFGVYEGYRLKQAQIVSANVPTAAFRERILARVPAYKQFFDLFPLPNGALAANGITGFYQTNVSGDAEDNHAVARGDVNFSEGLRLSARYTRGRPFRVVPNAIPGNQRNFNGLQEAGTLTLTQATATWNLETRFGYNLSEVSRLDGIYELGIPGIVGDLGFGTAGETVFLRGTTMTFEQAYARTFGAHSFKTGWVYGSKRNSRENIEVPEVRYASEADLLNNTPSAIRVTFGVNEFLVRQWNAGAFVQDDWKVNQRLTFNLGLRYDYFSVPRERDNRLFNREGPYGFGPLRPANNAYDADKNNFAPRLGFAWMLDREGKTVVRGGFGVLYNRNVLEGLVQDLVANAFDQPNRVEFTRADALRLGLRYPVTNAAVLPLVSGSSDFVFGNAYDTNLPNPYNLQRMLSVQRQLTGAMALEVAYIGSRATRIPMAFQMNLPDRVTGLRPNPRFSTFRFYIPSDTVNYNALQTSLRTRFRSGVSFNVNYTWSKTLGYTIGSSLATSEEGPNDNSNFIEDYGPTNRDLRHRFLVDGVYELPLQRLAGGNGLAARLLLGGWQVAGFFTAQSGSPLFISQSSSFRGSRPDYVGGETVLDDYRDTLQYLNREAFARVPTIAASGAPARPGTLGRGAVFGPGLWSVDLALSKNLQFTERWRLQLRADLFNALNHTNYTGISTNITAGNFGRITGTAGARTLQLNARLSF